MSAPLKWEFPGGKVEPGESARQALEREVREELGIDIDVGEHLGSGEGTVGTRTIHLEVFGAQWTGGKIVLSEHREYGWFGPEELAALDWPEADWPILPAVRRYLSAH